MNDDYLWDGSGTPDPEVERLEKQLGRFQHNQPKFEFPLAATSPPYKRPKRQRLWLAAAAVAMLLGGILVMRSLTGRVEWTISGVEGSPRINGKIVARKQIWKIGATAGN